MPACHGCGGVGHGRLLVEQGVEARAAALGPGQRAHRVDERRQGLADGHRHDHEQRRDRSARDGRVDQVGGGQRGGGGGDEQGGGDERAAAALPAHCQPQRVVRVRQPARSGALAADGLQLDGLPRHEVADPQHLGA